jgi:hypothetical protein
MMPLGYQIGRRQFKWVGLHYTALATEIRAGGVESAIRCRIFCKSAKVGLAAIAAGLAVNPLAGECPNLRWIAVVTGNAPQTVVDALDGVLVPLTLIQQALEAGGQQLR